jgi:hypothetical protein
MLRDAMSEILTMTSQAAPLDVKRSLYPRSAQAVFNQVKSEDGEPEVAPAPLPHFNDDDAAISHNGPPVHVSPNIVPSMPLVAQHHSGADMWQSQQQQQQQQQQHAPMQLPQVPQMSQMQMHLSGQSTHVRSGSYGGGY